MFGWLVIMNSSEDKLIRRTAQSYLANEFHQSSEIEARRRLALALCHRLRIDTYLRFVHGRRPSFSSFSEDSTIQLFLFSNPLWHRHGYFVISDTIISAGFKRERRDSRPAIVPSNFFQQVEFSV